jgi:tripartite-type tricarboxylate transporter receptor subunit TctC
MTRSIFSVVLYLLASVAAASAQSAVSDYPNKPIRFIIPASPGGGVDVFARIVAQGLTAAFKQPVIVDFKPGASSALGTEQLAKSAPDGYTIGVIQTQSQVIIPNIRTDLRYDPIKDFAPITKGISFGFVLVTNASVPAKSLSELIALAKAKPNEITFGSAGMGAANHLAGEFLALETNTKLKHVPYKSGVAANTDILGGHVTMGFTPPNVAIGFLNDGRMRGIAYTGMSRSKQLPDLPTLDELGLKGFEVTAWQGIAAPAGTPQPIIDKLHTEIMRIFKSPEAIKTLVETGGNDLANDTPEEFGEFIKTQLAQYREIVKKADIKFE